MNIGKWLFPTIHFAFGEYLLNILYYKTVSSKYTPHLLLLWSPEADCLPGPEPQQVLRDPPQHVRGHAPERLDGAAGENQGNLSSPVVTVTCYGYRSLVTFVVCYEMCR